VLADPADVDPAPEQVVAALWSGRRVLWLSADADDQGVAAARTVAAAHPGWEATVWRWPADRGEQMPPGTVALAAWGTVQVCTELDPAVADAFFTAAPPAPGADGSSPPAAFPVQPTAVPDA
jgi:hypothetical protein